MPPQVVEETVSVGAGVEVGAAGVRVSVAVALRVGVKLGPIIGGVAVRVGVVLGAPVGDAVLVGPDVGMAPQVPPGGVPLPPLLVGVPR
jgi:hypothetical protein